MGFVIGRTGSDLGLRSADEPICKHRCVGRHVICILNNSVLPFHTELFWVEVFERAAKHGEIDA